MWSPFHTSVHCIPYNYPEYLRNFLVLINLNTDINLNKMNDFIESFRKHYCLGIPGTVDHCIFYSDPHINLYF